MSEKPEHSLSSHQYNKGLVEEGEFGIGTQKTDEAAERGPPGNRGKR